MAMFSWKRNREQRKHLTLYARVFSLTILAIAVPLVGLGVVNYQTQVNNFKTEIDRADWSSLIHTANMSDQVLTMADRLSFQILRNRQFQQFFSEANPLVSFEDFEKTGNAINTLNSFTEGFDSIESVSAYSLINHRTLTSEYGIDRRFTPLSDEAIQHLAQQEDRVLWISVGQNGIFEEPASTVELIRFYSNSRNVLLGCIVTRLDAQKFQDLLNLLFSGRSARLQLVNRQGVSAWESPAGSEPLPIPESPGEGFSRRVLAGQIQRMAQTPSEHGGWLYQVELPEADIDRDAQALLVNLVWISTFLFLAALLTAAYLARGISYPILAIYRRLSGQSVDDKFQKGLANRRDELGAIEQGLTSVMHENLVLKGQAEQTFQSLSAYYLDKLITAENPDDSSLESLTSFFRLPLQGNFVVAVIRLHLSESTFSSTVKPAVQEALEELLKEDFRFLLSQEEPDRCTVLITWESEAPLQKLEANLRLFRTTLVKRNGLRSALAMGTLVTEAQAIHKSYRSAVQLLKFNPIEGVDGLAVAADHPSDPSETLLQDRFVNVFSNYLDSGRFQDAIQVVVEMREGLRQHGSLASHFTFAALNFLKTLEVFAKRQGDHKVTQTSIHQAIQNFDRQFSDLDEAHHFIVTTIQALSSVVINDAGRASFLSQQTLAILQAEYSRDLSLSEVAARLRISDAYLSRIFKENCGVNFKEKLIEIKMSKARELLCDESLEVKEVSALVGYGSPVQFSRMFKKIEGISPQEFKQNQRRQRNA